MAIKRSEELKATFSRQNLIFTLFISVCVLFGIVCILGSVIWKQEYRDTKEKQLIFRLGQSIPSTSATPTNQLEELFALGRNDALVPDLVRDIGIAFLISAFVTFSIERYASNRLRQHITYDVLSAAYAKIVPEEIYTQIADNIFRSDVCRRSWEVHIEAKDGQLVDGVAIITSTYSYSLENLNEREIQFPVLAGIDLDVPVRDPKIPKFNSFSVTGEGKEALVSNADVDVLLQAPADQNTPEKRRGNLVMQRDSQALRLIAQVKMPSRGSITVMYQVERPIRVPGNYILSAAVPADGIKIIINVRGFKLDVVPLHPDRDALRHPQHDTWTFAAGILPWQSFRFTSEL